ncbi:hypothetical protein [Microbacterium indicum]|uniref:hypothetical protein n=1 Tax=Microbacterium indicum TaxID=358100 RepID=UPI00048E9668|nr:hypothetical protein [Microbacterium indicum]
MSRTLHATWNAPAEQPTPREHRREMRRIRRAAKPLQLPVPKHAVMWLTIAMGAGILVSAGLVIAGLVTGAGILTAAGFVVAGAAVGIPLLVAGWIFARAIRRTAGVFGVTFVAGVIAAAAGYATADALYSYAGWAVVVLSFAAVYLIVTVPRWRREAAGRERRRTRSAKRRERRAEAVRRGTR